jgi:hypothetical protein
MTFVVSTGQVYLCLVPGKEEGGHFRVMSVSPDGEVLLKRIQPGPWGYFSGSIVATDTDLANDSCWTLVLESDRDV